MTEYSDWIIIPADRKCDLEPRTKVQVLRCDQTLESAEEVSSSRVFCFTINGRWPKHIFAYRYVIEPVTEVREYTCRMNFRRHAPPLITWYVPEDIENWGRGTATQIIRDGKPYDFHWKADE
jgi:hypothetical protein